jgi:hypothetical protein
VTGFSNLYVLNTLLKQTFAKPQHEVQSRLLLDNVVCERAPVLELLVPEDEQLLVKRHALLVLDLALHHVNRVARLHLESDSLASQCFDKDLHRVDCCLYIALRRAFTTPCIKYIMCAGICT